MPTKCLCLFGFLDQGEALAYLKNVKHPAGQDDAALITEWLDARAKLGEPMANFGSPGMSPLAAESAGYEQSLRQAWGPFLQTPDYMQAQFMFVEIDPLLAFQFNVEVDRSSHHCARLGNPPKTDELLSLCLPLKQDQEQLNISLGNNSIIVSSKSLNVRLMDAGLFNDTLGIKFGVSVPLVQVVRYNGRCYLHNGFHRAYGARMAGASHIPCLVRDVTSPNAVGINPGTTFASTTLESDNPPTLGHFTQGRAHHLSTKRFNRVLHLSWAEHAIPID